jgi:hypothetical protein
VTERTGDPTFAEAGFTDDCQVLVTGDPVTG